MLKLPLFNWKATIPLSAADIGQCLHRRGLWFSSIKAQNCPWAEAWGSRCHPDHFHCLMPLLDTRGNMTTMQSFPIWEADLSRNSYFHFYFGSLLGRLEFHLLFYWELTSNCTKGYDLVSLEVGAKRYPGCFGGGVFWLFVFVLFCSGFVVVFCFKSLSLYAKLCKNKKWHSSYYKDVPNYARLQGQ